MKTAPDILNRLWALWLSDFSRENADMLAWLPTYSRVQRNSPRGIKFETWLESHGGRVVQKDKVRYIEIWNEEQFMMLVLAHA